MKTASPETPEQLNDRARDNWEPLVAIAELCGLGGEARAAALTLSGESPEENEIGTLLLSAIREIFHNQEADKIASKELVKELSKRDEDPWPTWGKQEKGITQNHLAGLLKPFGIRSGNVWVGSRCLKGYALSDLQDAFSRYIPLPETLDPLDPNGDAGLSHISEALGGGTPSASQNHLKASTDAGSSGLADRKGG